MTGSLTYRQRLKRRDPIESGYFRSPPRRDRDRVRYSPYFRRLSEVTQVTHSEEAQLYHNRLTHSLKVAQLSSALARMFLIRQGVDPKYADGRFVKEDDFPDKNSLATSLDPYVVEAAAHAHDIGHPPFGHRGEQVLDDLVDTASDGEAGFEGNAQSFRVVTQIAPRNQNHGFNLTRATLNAMTKYPWSRSADAAKDENGDPDKWGYYTDPGTGDEAVFNWARKPLEDRDGEQVLEAQIMDWADDITYAIHDLQDFFRAGLIPIDELVSEACGQAGSQNEEVDQLALSSNKALDEFEEYLDEESKIDPADIDIAEFFTHLAENAVDKPEVIMRPFSGREWERSGIKTFTSRLVARYMEVKRKKEGKYIKLTEDEGQYNLDIHSKYRAQIEVLKSLTRYYVISNPTLMQLQHGQEKVLRNLFDDLMEEAESVQGSSFPKSAIPSPYRERLKKSPSNDVPVYRIVADFIASLTEQQALSLHKRLHGWAPGSIQRDITG